MRESLNELADKIADVHELIKECYKSNHERSESLKKLEECALWLKHCERESDVS